MVIGISNKRRLSASICPHLKWHLTTLTKSLDVLRKDGYSSTPSDPDIYPGDILRVCVNSGVDLNSPLLQLAVSIERLRIVWP
jgi:hypothetical protein